jgi:hypothetical protein
MEFYTQTDRLYRLTKDRLNELPRTILRSMLIDYLYADVFDGFKMFFGKYNKVLLVDVALGLKSR